MPRHTFEKWRIALRVGDTYLHPFHVHGTQFRILKVDGAPPPPHMAGGKDTVLVNGASNSRGESGSVEVLLRFDHEAARPHPYMIHCHNLEHEDGGMMLGFEVA